MTNRQDTKLEAEGAEFLVLGNLLIEGISCFKAYVNFPGYDLLAFNSENSKTARIQVKSRWATNYGKFFLIRNFDCDFIVHVALNRGFRFGKSPKSGDNGVREPLYYIFPVQVVLTAQNEKSKWGKVFISKIPEYDKYCNNWSLIAEYLNGSSNPVVKTNTA